jgi:hypothetical protein
MSVKEMQKGNEGKRLKMTRLNLERQDATLNSNANKSVWDLHFKC